ncbi:MAG: phosphopyruvate hydratase [Candidatus Brockarchaeota archaeon]|nr:phosphopyruvate hydratase [Candidatus Brockarchaeota archaeon]
MGENIFRIKRVRGREIIDSRSNPTVEAIVELEGGSIGRAGVPSGASTGRYEAIELRDRDEKRFHGLGVSKAVRNINEVIGPALVGLDSRNQREIDAKMLELDGTQNKSKLGANAILAVSLGNALAASEASRMEFFEYLGEDKGVVLPVPLMNVINGGKHAGNDLSIQEFMIIPAGFKDFPSALRAGVEVYQTLKNVIVKKYGRSSINVGDEGGFAPPLSLTEQALELLHTAIKETGYSLTEVFLGIDAASSSFYDSSSGKYRVDGKNLTSGDLLDYYVELVSRFKLKSIEDPFEENDFKSFAEITRKIGSKVQIVGDDLFVTNRERLVNGIRNGAANALLFKLNQCGSLTESLDTFKTAVENKYRVIVSHRSGETEDTYISDIAVALNAGQIKTGAPCRGERTAKYNRLLRINDKLGSRAKYGGLEVFNF